MLAFTIPFPNITIIFSTWGDISGLSKKFLSHSFPLSVNSFFGLPAFDWVGLMRSLNLFVNAEMTFLRFLGLFGSVFAALLDLMWACEKAESSFCSVTRFAAVVATHADVIEVKNFLLQLKNQRSVWLFYYFNFQRNYDEVMIKSKSPWILLN